MWYPKALELKLSNGSLPDRFPVLLLQSPLLKLHMFEWRSRWGFPLASSSSSAWQCNSEKWRLGATFFLIVLMIGWDFMTFLYVSIHHYIKHVITITVMYNAYPCMHVDILCCIFISQSVTEPTCKTYECRFPPLFDVGVFFWTLKPQGNCAFSGTVPGSYPSHLGTISGITTPHSGRLRQASQASNKYTCSVGFVFSRKGKHIWYYRMLAGIRLCIHRWCAEYLSE